jgi:hypothetical protein
MPAGGESEGYELVRCLRSDPVSELFEATCPGQRDRRFLLEIFDGAAESHPGWAAFERDRMAASRLQHPALLQTLEIGTMPDGTPLAVMENAGTQTLAEWLERNPTPPIEEAVAFVRALAEGLASAHDHGLAHGDLRPEHVMVAERPERALGTPRLGGFGTRWLRPEDTLIRSGVPEAAGGADGLGPEERAADLRGLALVAERLLTPAELGGLAAGRCFGTGPAVYAVIARAMGERPTSRFSSVMDLTDELEQAVANDGAAGDVAWDAPLPAVRAQAQGRPLLPRVRLAHAAVAGAALGLVAAFAIGAFRVKAVRPAAVFAPAAPAAPAVPAPTPAPSPAPAVPLPVAAPAAPQVAPPPPAVSATPAARGVVWSLRLQRLASIAESNAAAADAVEMQ